MTPRLRTARAGGALVLCLLAFAATARAQDPAPQPTAAAQPNGLAHFADQVLAIFRGTVHPSLGSVAPGGGITGGVGYSPKPWVQHHLFVTGNAAASVRKYWGVNGDVAWQYFNRFRVEAYGRARSMAQLTYYGLGSSGPESAQTDFRLLERSAGSTGWFRPEQLGEIIAFGGRLERLWPRVGAGTRTDLPSIEQGFTDASAPGLALQPSFVHAQVFVNINYPANNEVNRQGGDYQIAYGAFSDRSQAGFSFRRLDVEMRQRFSVFGRDRTLTLHALASLSTTSGTNRVPFYLMQTLGGANNLLGVHDDLIGGDSSTATLRGFSDFRFRDRDLVLLQADYRFKVSGFVQASVFADAGKAVSRNADVNLRNLRHDFGVGVSIVRGSITVVRFDMGLGGGEGLHPFFTIGKGLAF